jgi:hypothetical protein
MHSTGTPRCIPESRIVRSLQQHLADPRHDDHVLRTTNDVLVECAGVSGYLALLVGARVTLRAERCPGTRGSPPATRIRLLSPYPVAVSLDPLPARRLGGREEQVENRNRLPLTSASAYHVDVVAT